MFYEMTICFLLLATLVDSRDFRIMEKQKRREPYVFTAESWYRLVEMASKKKASPVLGMKAKINVELLFFF
jgi:hypothetical protein